MATGTSASGLLQQLQQLGDVRRDPRRFIFAEQLGRTLSDEFQGFSTIDLWIIT